MKWSQLKSGDVFEHTSSGSIHLVLERDGDRLRLLGLTGLFPSSDHWIDVRRFFFRDEQEAYTVIARAGNP